MEGFISPFILNPSVPFFLALLFVLTPVQAQEMSADGSNRIQQRQLYTDAQAALTNGNAAEFQQLLEQLSDYPLLPYLQYAELSRDLSSQPSSRIDDFLAAQAGTVLSSRLERQWLTELINAHRSEELIRYYNPANTTVEITCHVLQAQLDSGDVSALDAVAPLWNVATSQPNICDPVFAAWLQAGRLEPVIGWQRFSKTLKAGNVNLARYVAGLLPAREQALAQTFLEVHETPAYLSRLDAFSVADGETVEIVQHGLQRLALTNSTMALELFHTWAPRLPLADAERLALERYIVQRMLFQGHVAAAETLLRDNPALRSDGTGDWLLRNALGEQDWGRFHERLTLVPDTVRDSERWRYWQARSLMLQNTPEAESAAEAIYRELAQLRSFYGFLSADFLGQEYEFVDRPVAVSAIELLQLSQLPALQRAHELYLLGDEANALREWDHAVARINATQVLAAGKLASTWGWHRNSIQAMIRASYWDDLELRFPIVYQEHVVEAVNTNPLLNNYYVNAIARQESAFMPEVVSSAGAMGLMQLMPATARELARDVGISISNQELFTPATNITLGSRYLAQQLAAFGGNRILAAAAYNAGPNRVRQWLAQSGQSIPFDIWIETLPYAETRGYVQNVLAFAVIYAHRSGERLSLINDGEATISGR